MQGPCGQRYGLESLGAGTLFISTEREAWSRKNAPCFICFFQNTTSPDVPKCHNQRHWSVGIHMVQSHTHLSVKRCYTVGERLVPCGQFIYRSSLYAHLLLHCPPAEGCLSDGGLWHAGQHSLLPWVWFAESAFWIVAKTVQEQSSWKGRGHVGPAVPLSLQFWSQFIYILLFSSTPSVPSFTPKVSALCLFCAKTGFEVKRLVEQAQKQQQGRNLSHFFLIAFAKHAVSSTLISAHTASSQSAVRVPPTAFVS